MPELPEIEAWARDLDALVSRAAIDHAGPAHVATLKTIEPPLATLDGRRLAGAGRRGKNLLFPTGDGEPYADFFPVSDGVMSFPGWAPFEGADAADLEQDLRLLVDLLDAGPLRGLRATHASALGA